jgi:hypothetical protein
MTVSYPPIPLKDFTCFDLWSLMHFLLDWRRLAALMAVHFGC